MRERAANTALTRILGSVDRAMLVLRLTGIVEVLLGLLALGFPHSAFPGFGISLLGCAFLFYLSYGKKTAPTSSCGCTASSAPIGWRSFTRAGLVVAGGGLAVYLSSSGLSAWWSTLGPATLGLAAPCLVMLGLLSEDPRWLLPLRRLRLRVFGHPLGGGGRGGGGDSGPRSAGSDFGEPPPIEATIDLLDRSLAWEKMSPYVRSGLLEHWDDDGWRVLRFSGTYDETPVFVLFALPVHDTLATAAHPTIRVTMVDAATSAVLEPAVT